MNHTTVSLRALAQASTARTQRTEALVELLTVHDLDWHAWSGTWVCGCGTRLLAATKTDAVDEHRRHLATTIAAALDAAADAVLDSMRLDPVREVSSCPTR